MGKKKSMHAFNRDWIREYLSQAHSAAISDDYSLITVEKPPNWMFSFMMICKMNRVFF